MRAKLISVAVAFVGSGALLGAGSAATTAPWIVFAASPKQGTQPSQLIRVRISGAGLKQITSGHRPAVDPSFAPDGRHVAFTRLSTGLFVTNVDGTGVRRLTGNGSDRFPVYSPNGHLIAFIRASKTGGYRLWLMNADGRKERPLRRAPELSGANRPAWTGDGTSLIIATDGVFYRVSATQGRVRSRLRPVYDASLGQLFWTMSPSGRMLGYVGRRPEPAGCEGAACEVFALYLQAVTAVHPKRSVADAGVPGWSPDSRRVVYAHRGVLQVQPAGGGARRAIAVDGVAPDAESPPAWQPR